MQVIRDTPLGSLLRLQEGVYLDRPVILALARDFDCDKMTIKFLGSEYLINDDDFADIMGIKDGSGPICESPDVSLELLEKFVRKNRDGKHEDLSADMMEEVLKSSDDNDLTKQAFTLLAMNYIICPTTYGKLAKKMINYVQDVKKLSEQPWVRLAMQTLKNGLVTYQKAETSQVKQKNISGCVLFLQLYCMRLEGLRLDSGIDQEITRNFCDSWKIHYAFSNPMSDVVKKRLMGNVSDSLKTLSNLLKASPGTISQEDLFEMNAFTEKYLKKLRSQQDQLLEENDHFAENIETETTSREDHNADKPKGKRKRSQNLEVTRLGIDNMIVGTSLLTTTRQTRSKTNAGTSSK